VNDDTTVVNASGFLFQLAVVHHIKSTRNEHGWEVISEEHPWHNTNTGDRGYLDLLLGWGLMRILVECKRRKNATWYFIGSHGAPVTQNRARFAWSGFHQGKTPGIGWQDFLLTPRSPEAAFCLTRGTGEDDGNVLERMCNTLLDCLDCIAAEELELFQRAGVARWSVYVPAIITNADLKVCAIDPSAISLADGTIGDAACESVPLIRFRKSLSTVLTPGAQPMTFEESSRNKERTVLIINAQGLSKTLRGWDIGKLDSFERLPWEIGW